MRKFSIFKFWSLKWQIDPKFGIYKKYKQENDWFKQKKKMSFEKKSIMDQRLSLFIFGEGERVGGGEDGKVTILRLY